MANKIEIQYVADSFCGEPCTEEIDEVLDDLSEAGLVVDDSYFDHIRSNHGGVPLTRYFPGGAIERFLNFADRYRPAGA